MVFQVWEDRSGRAASERVLDHKNEVLASDESGTQLAIGEM